jgi:hypothetical protein
MKKFQSREYNPMEESQVPKSIKLNKSKNPLLKNFNQRADHNIEKSKSTVEYRELPSECVEEGTHKLPEDNVEEKDKIKEEDKKNAKHAMKFKKAVENFKKLTSELGIESSIVKSLDEIDCDSITEDQYSIFEKTINDMDEEGFAIFINMVKSNKTEKAMSSAMGSGGDLVAPQLAGGKKLVKVKKGVSKSFFVQPDQH